MGDGDANGWALLLSSVLFVAIGVVFGYREFVVLGLASAACVLVAILWMANRPELQVVREISPVRVVEGETARATLTVTNTGDRRSPPLVASEEVAGKRLRVGVPSLRPLVSFTETYELPTVSRGPLPGGSVDSELIRPTAPVGRRQRVRWGGPAVGAPPHPAGTPIARRQIPGMGRADQRRSSAGGVAFHSLREYEVGDDLRLIHWRSTAKTGKLMVRHNVVTMEPEMMLVLDTSAEPYLGEDFEDAVRIAASLALAGSERRYPVELWTTGGLSARIEQSGDGRSSVLDRLAVAEPARDDPGLGALTSLAPNRAQGTVLGVITGRLTPERARPVGTVRRRYSTVTVVQVGPSAPGPPVDVAGITYFNVASSDEFAQRWGSVAR